MASLTTNPNKTRVIQTVPSLGRKTIRLDKATAKTARAILGHVEALEAQKINGYPASDATQQWLKEIDVELHERVARAGLVERAERHTLDTWIERCIEQTSKTAVAGTITRLRQSLRVACDFFGRDRALTGIARRDVMGYATFLSGKYSGSTARKKLADFKSWMRLAHERRHTPSDPAAGVFIDADPSTKTYLIRSGDYCKIGKAVNVRKRLAELQCGNPLPLDLIHAHGHDCEKELHERFAPMREKGEWFRIEGDLANYLRAFTHRRAAISAAH